MRIDRSWRSAPSGIRKPHRVLPARPLLATPMSARLYDCTFHQNANRVIPTIFIKTSHRRQREIERVF
jgi:hypothetical protein